ncbi:kanadaptin isoform X2 [Eleutherodactylus coqui]|uniref:kanadaptin isoform X2 n=1 Tax=Eleutherodactylus coqui TaxID=57060 RepID=UPI0034636CA0
MEAAQLSPVDGERPGDPRALEAGDKDSNGGNETTCHDDDGTQGNGDNQRPYDAGAPRPESTPAGDPRIRSHETPGDGHNGGSRNPRTRGDEGSNASSTQGSKDSGSGQSHGDARTRSTAKPWTGTDETTIDRRSGIPKRIGDDETTIDRRSGIPKRIGDDETTIDRRSGLPEGIGTNETTFDRRSGLPEGIGTNETTFDRRSGLPEGIGNDETTINRRSRPPEGIGSHETTIDHRSSFPEGIGNDETTSDRRSGFPEGIRPTSREGAGDGGAISNRSEKHESPSYGPCPVPNNARASSPDQRLTRSYGLEGADGARTCNKRSDVSSAESHDAGATGPTEQLHSESSKGGHGSESSTLESSSDRAESFKKPILPFRSGWNEKTLDQHIKPVNAAPSPPQLPSPISSHRETAPDHRARLPSDAYRSCPAVPYEEPSWSGRPPALYSLEVLKGGSILSTKNLNDATWTIFGRLPTCHVSLEHPSVSRYHAVLQYRAVPGSEPDQEPGFYVYDLGSTHGTFINKQRIQSKTYCRFRVGHVLKFGGSTRLFILQGPEKDQEAESELTVTQIKEARRQKESLQKRMLGDDSDEEDNLEGEEEEQRQPGGADDSGCMWGMGEDAVDEENDVNPIAMEYQAEREALYSANPKKTLQGFFDREGEELDFEYEEQGIGSWLCRVKLPVDDSSGKQLVTEVVHSGKKRDAMRLCSLEACRMLDMRGLLRQEAVSRKRKAKQWEAEDFYDSDDDTFLDRTGIVEKKRLNRMKKAGKIEEKPETYESLTAKLDLVEKDIVEIAAKLKTNRQDEAQTSSQDSLDAFMTEIKSGASVDSVTRKKLHLQSLELKKEQQRLKSLIKIVQPTRLPELKANTAEDCKTKKPALPMFGAMKGGRKFKLKTGTVGKLPPKRTDLPSSLFTVKGDSNEEEEEEDEDDDMQVDTANDSRTESKTAQSQSIEKSKSSDPGICPSDATDVEEKIPTEESKKNVEVASASRGPPKGHSPLAAQTEVKEEEKASKTAPVKQKKMLGPSRPPRGALASSYPEDDPDYCVWTPPAGQTGDGKTHLNEKYGY